MNIKDFKDLNLNEIGVGKYYSNGLLFQFKPIALNEGKENVDNAGFVNFDLWGKHFEILFEKINNEFIFDQLKLNEKIFIPDKSMNFNDLPNIELLFKLQLKGILPIFINNEKEYCYFQFQSIISEKVIIFDKDFKDNLNKFLKEYNMI